MKRKNPTRAALLALIILAGLGLAACGDDNGGDDVAADGVDTTTTAATADEVACDDLAAVGATVRLPPGENTAVYVELTNNGTVDTALVGATADFAADYELHETTMEDGVLEMRPVEPQRIELAAGGTVVLEPGGLHVMAMGVTTELAEGDIVEVTLEFDGGCTVTVDAEVRALDMPMDDTAAEGEEPMGG